jgi:hypothetical protein
MPVARRAQAVHRGMGSLRISDTSGDLQPAQSLMSTMALENASGASCGRLCPTPANTRFS